MKIPVLIGKPVPDKQSIKTFQETLSTNGIPFDKIITILLLQRGINTYEKAKSFFTDNLDNLHNPFLMADMTVAVRRLIKQIETNEPILIFGDYDVDGTTAVSLIYLFLKNNFPELSVKYYIPDRYSEGYGISLAGIDFAKKNSCSLMIALDCGIKAIDEIKYAKEQDIDVIVCDHHTPDDILPDAVAILDPKRKDCNYPYKELSGCGVGFKLLQALSIEKGIALDNLFSFIDLVALSIASDIVPITDENRILCRYGLKKIIENPLPGIRAIMKQLGILGEKIEVSDLVFKIGPRINASGRMTHAKESVKLLIGKISENLIDKADTVNILNTKRKEIDAIIRNEAFEMIKQSADYYTRKSIVLLKNDWYKGVLGIVASRVVEEFYKPTVLLTESEGMLVGSARSVDGFDLYEAIDACRDYLENYGGHKFAAGLSMKKESFKHFYKKFEEYVASKITDTQLEKKLQFDLEISLSEINWQLFRKLNLLRPFGPGNMTPVFVTSALRDTGKSKIVGKHNDHLQLFLTDGKQEIKAIAFGMADKLNLVKHSQIKICYTIESNHYRGESSLQLFIKAIFDDTQNK